MSGGHNSGTGLARSGFCPPPQETRRRVYTMKCSRAASARPCLTALVAALRAPRPLYVSISLQFTVAVNPVGGLGAGGGVVGAVPLENS